MKYCLHNLFILAVLSVCGNHFAVAENASPGTDETGAEELPFDEIRTFTEVFAKVKDDYVEPVDDKKLLENAIRGMLEGLDPHSSYLDKEAYQELQEGTTGQFGGLGIEVGMENGFVKVIAPIDDTPADKAGIKAGDLIIRLNETPVKGMSLNDAVKIMRGKPGTRINLTVVRENAEKPLKITITRDIIKIKSVRSKTLEPGFAYLRISHFQTHTPDDLRREMTKLMEDNNNDIKGLVLDLRNNPGGVLSAAVEVSDDFLEKGLIVYTEGRVNDSKLKFNAKPEDMLNNAPIVVLVNAGSASASEIVAGALQDHKRAIIMGQQTFGKGSVQTILPLPNEAALKLTTARYYTPSGRSIQASGITPDIVIDKLKVENINDGSNIVKEANLNRHLENDRLDEDTSGKNSAASNETNTQGQSLSASDYELYEALNVLKGLSILKKKAG
ncbi:MAG: S41 family peptidase [Gammaproteobacteria bacterium]